MAQYEDFTFDQGADAAIELHLTQPNGAAKNLTGYSVEAKIKKTYSSDSADTTPFTAIVSNASTGIVTLALTNIQTGALKSGRYVYDVELSFLDSDSNTIVERILEGKIQITPSVTK